ncbi:TonB-dependent receptor [Desulfosarcina ovata subsp. sediminis]|uniref:TonB-dependent receptor n=1 Tax=Desulfosarcina ovata subsp. sediminis TaxID=885957 RepID=A0A5K7ZUF2_9BACT|nr:TonB-dependent receptor [Desulfosarcina ovata]BBO83849.1 TonB-dependent receptor [Desulfosarcina ovata subsp. sediminis]
MQWNKKNVAVGMGMLVAGMIFVFGAGAQASDDGQVFTLGEVVVTGERAAATTATAVTEVSAAQIAAKGASTAAEALKFLPGVVVQNAGKGESHVSVRGFEQNQVKLLIDGVPARESYFGTVDLSMLPADAISKITITKGVSSVLYGANTMGGVINIITKKGGRSPQTTFTAGFGDYRTAHYALSHGGSAGVMNYWISGGYRTSDGYRLSDHFDADDPDVGLGTSYNEDGGKRDLSDYTKKNLDVKVGYDPGGNSSLYLSFDYVDNERGMPVFYNRYWSYDHWRQWQVNLVGEHSFSEALKIKTRLFYVNHDDGIKDVSWDDDHSTSGKKWFEESYYDDDSIGGEIQTTSRLASWNTLRFSLHYLEDTHKEANWLTDDCWDVIKGWASEGWTDEEEYAARTVALAAEDEISLSDRLSVVLGLSYDTFEPTKTADQPEPGKMDTFNPQIGVVFNVTDATGLHASVGKKTRFPSLKELYSEYGGGNPDLDPEETIAYEMGASQRFSEKITGELAVFYNNIEDLIDTETIDGNKVYVNINEAVIYGAEAVVRLQLSDHFDAELNYTYLETKDRANNDRELEGRPRHRVNLSMSYRFDFGLTANLQATYCQRQFYEDDDYEWTELPDYLLVNAKLTQQLKKISGVGPEIFFQGANVLDKDYYETSGPEPGFNFLAGITLRM